MLKENLALVEKEIQEACKRAGRERKEVTLIAVSAVRNITAACILFFIFHLPGISSLSFILWVVACCIAPVGYLCN